MPYLQKTWIRILISLFASGIILELIIVTFSDPNQRNRQAPGSFALLIFAAVIYFILTAYVKRKTRKY